MFGWPPPSFWGWFCCVGICKELTICRCLPSPLQEPQCERTSVYAAITQTCLKTREKVISKHTMTNVTFTSWGGVWLWGHDSCEVTVRGGLTAGLKHERENFPSPSPVFVLSAAPWDRWNSHGFLSVLVTLPQLVDVQINVKSPLSFEKSCRRLFLTGFFLLCLLPCWPHRVCYPGCKRSCTRSFRSWDEFLATRRATWKQSEMSIPASRNRTFVCWRKMDEVGIPVYYSSHSKQNSSFCFDGQIFQVWTPKPATLYQILTIWGPIINLNLKCGESLMVFSQVFCDTSHRFCTKVRTLHTLELNSNIKGSFK